MRKIMPHIYLIFFLAFSGNAMALTLEDLPEHVSVYLNKKHPKAEDVEVTETIHFGHNLYEVKFKESKLDKNNKPYKAEMAELFWLDGDFFTNVITVQHNAFNIMTDAVNESLELHYPEHEILSMRVVNNPNGVGREYEMDLLVEGKIKKISIDDKGKLISEQNGQ